MIVYEYFGIASEIGGQTERFAVIAVTESGGNLSYVIEVGHHGIVYIGVFLRLNVRCFAVCSYNLKVCRRALAGDIGSLGKYGLNVGVSHVLGGIDAETVDSHIHQISQVVGDFGLG